MERSDGCYRTFGRAAKTANDPLSAAFSPRCHVSTSADLGKRKLGGHVAKNAYVVPAQTT